MPFRSPIDNIQQIKESQELIKDLYKLEENMLDSMVDDGCTNEFNSSRDYHARNLIVLERMERQLDRLIKYVKSTQGNAKGFG